MAQIFEQSLENIDAKLTQMEQTVRQMSDDQFIANLAIGQVADVGVGDATGSINAHIRKLNEIVDQINTTVNTLDSDLVGIQGLVNTIEDATASLAGYSQQTTGVTTAGATAVVDMSASPASKFGLKVTVVGDTSAWSVVIEGDIINSFAGDNTTLLTHGTATGTSVVVFVVDKPVRFMRARTASITRVTGSITINIFAMT